MRNLSVLLHRHAYILLFLFPYTSFSQIALVSSDIRPDAYNVSVPDKQNNWINATINSRDESDYNTTLLTGLELFDLPVTVDDTYSLEEGGSLTIAAPGVLENDTDADGDILTAVKATDPVHAASFNLSNDGSFSYIHDGSPTILDGFTYSADDGTGQSLPANVTLNITPVNDDPVISGIAGETIEEGGEFGAFDLDDYVTDEEDNDESLTWTASGNSDLSVTINESTHIATVVAPDDNWNGSENITFTVTDSENGTDSEVAEFTVNAAPAEAPVAVGDAYEVTEGGNISVPVATGVLSNDTDSDGDVLTAVLVSGPANQSAFTLNTDGSFTYTHNGTETTTDAFTYHAYDGTQYSNTVTVNITVNPINDAPFFNSDIPDQTISEGGSFTTIVLDNFISDPDDADSEISWSTTGSSELTVSISPGRVATITTPGANWSGSETIVFVASDPDLASANNSAVFTVTSENDPPVVTDIPDQTINEGAAFATINLDGYVTDPDHADNLITWAASGNSQLTVSISNRVATITAPNINWYGSETITFEATDPANAKDSDAATFTINNVNDNPILAGIEGGSINYAEGSGPVQITSTLTVDDADNSLISATITISSNYQNDQDVLSFENNYGLTGSWNDATGALTLTGTTTPANFQAALRTVRYTNTSMSPSTLTRTITFVVNDGTVASNTQSRNLTINSSNSTPVLGETSSGAVSFTEGGTAVQLTNTITVADDDNTTLSSARVAVTVGLQAGADILTFTGSGGITGNYNSTTGELLLSGNATLNNYRSVLRSVRFSNNSDAPATTSRTVSFSVNDGISNSNNIDKTVTVTAVNDKPVLSGIETSDLTFPEGGGAIAVTGTITLTDVDNITLPSAIISISSNYQPDQDVLLFTNSYGLTGSWNSTLGQLVLSGSASPADFQAALRTVRYNNTSVNPNLSSRTVRFIVSDGLASSDAVTRNINLTSINNSPVLADPVTTAVVFTEGAGPVQVTSTITVTDDDSPALQGATVTIISGLQPLQDILTFSASGGVSGSYNAASGVLTLSGVASPSAYQIVLRSIRYDNSSEVPDIIDRVLSFVVTDGTAPSNSIHKTISITAQNDAPVATNLVMTATNNHIGTLHTGTFTFTDPDGDDPGTHVYQWYRSENAFGNLAVPITGAVSATYKPVKADGGKYIGFKVTPVDEFGLAGTTVQTASFTYINAAPVASNVRIYAPVAQAGSPISGRYAYTDKENNPRGNGIYHWYRSDVSNPTPSSPGTPIGTADSTYLLSNAEAGKWVWYRVNPVATAGSTPGDSVWSNIIGPIGKFTASLAGSDTFCYGATMPLSLTITGGKSPYTAVLHRAGTLPVDTTITNITLSPRTINVKIPGTYTIVKVTDESSDEADILTATPAVLVINPRSKVTISGSAAICKAAGTHSLLSLNFTAGTKPWSVTIRRKETTPVNDTVITNITDDPYNFMGRIIGDGPTRHRVVAITDANGCPGDTASGSAWLNYRISPVAEITGSDTICQGTTAMLTATLVSGTVPWSFTYLRNGVNPVTISNIQTISHKFQVSLTGSYTISSVTDASGTGCGAGKADLVAYTPPTAVISGTATMCEHMTTNVSVSLTGKSPWKFGYTRNLTLDSTSVENVLNSPKSVAVSKQGTYRLYEVIDRNGCRGTVSGSAVITVTQAPDVTISGLKHAYDFNSPEIDTIIGTPSGGDYSGPGVIGNYFIPKIAGLGMHKIVYRFRTSPGSCYGYDTTVVNVLESDAIIRFEGDRIRFCKNDAPFIVRGINLDGSVGNFTISGNLGIVDHGDNTATIYPSALQINRYTITYTYFKTGTPFFETAYFDLGMPPVAAFKWATECYHAGQPINFVNNSTPSSGYLTDTSYFWKIKTNSGFDADTIRDITYTFAQPGVYEISLKIEDSYGCTDTSVQYLNLRETVNLKAQESYFENFDNNPLGWQSGKSEYPVNSWQLGTPSKHETPPRGFSGAYSAPNSWYTKITSSPAPAERSWVSSPCFDFTGMNNPMLTLKIWRLFNSNRDGANIVVTADSGKTWNLVGDIDDGENWFNTYYIRGNPGGKPIGWSNDDGVSNDGGWVRARHSLDFLKDKKDVQFRIAYGSSESAQNNDGIAFDDFEITHRTKMTFIEHFTNSTLEASEKADSTLDSFMESYGTHAINVQYHTGPDGDLFFEQNPVVPTSRQFYYGLSAVPYSVIDGGTDSRYQVDYIKNSKPFDKNKIIVRSLEDSKFQVRVDAERTGDNVTAYIQIKSNQVFPLIELSLKIAVIESIVEGVNGENGDTIFRNVVRAMLPDAAGINIYRAWDIINDYHPEDQTWQIQNVENPENLQVVAFLQNESTREIYNAELDTVVLATGTIERETDKSGTRLFDLYPNPARNVANIRFINPTREVTTLELYNNLGRLVYSTRVPRGTELTEIPVEEYPEGLYILRLVTKNKLLGVSKLIISQ